MSLNIDLLHLSCNIESLLPVNVPCVKKVSVNPSISRDPFTLHAAKRRSKPGLLVVSHSLVGGESFFNCAPTFKFFLIIKMVAKCFFAN